MNIRKSMMLGMAMGVPLGLFKFWPFTVVFLLLGILATIVISAIIGTVVNFLLVLFIEYLLMASAIFIALYIKDKSG